MLKKWMIGISLLSLMACSEPKQNQKNPEIETNQPVSSVPASSTTTSQNLTFADIPNQNTVYETIEPNSIDENEALMTYLQTELLKDQFDLFEKDSGASWSENDCDQNKIIKVKGDGIRSYRAVSQVKVGDDKKTRPDFVLLVFAFDTEQQAQQSFHTLDSAVGSGQGLCNGKAPEQLVLNGREIYYFTTRAEMFRDYLNKYSALVNNYKSSTKHEN